MQSTDRPDMATRAPRRLARWMTLLALATFALGAPVLALNAPDGVRIPTVREHPPTDPPDSALFRHWSHDDYQCVACHPGVFPQRRLGFTHDDMKAGAFCGSCHNGSEAFAPTGKGIDCETCHVPEKTEDDDLDEDLW